MSTAIAEAPAAETTTQKAEPSPVLQSLLRPTVTDKDGRVLVRGADPAPKEEKKVEAAAEAVKETPKEVPKEQAKATPEQSFADLRKARDAAEKLAQEREEAIKARDAEIAAVRNEYETYKKNPVPKEFEERLTKAEQERADYEARLRQAALEKDPGFQRKYDAPIKTAMERMTAAATNAGIDAKEAQVAVARWDEGKFGEWLDAMPATQRLQFEAAYQRAIELDTARGEELKNSEQAWAEHQKRQQEEYKTHQERFISDLKDAKKNVLADLLDKQEIFKNDEGLRKEVEGLLDRATGLNGEKMGNREVLSLVANAQVLARHFQRVDTERAELKTKLEAAEKTLAERDEFIKSLNGSIPTPGPTTTGTKDEKKALVEKLLRPNVVVPG